MSGKVTMEFSVLNCPGGEEGQRLTITNGQTKEAILLYANGGDVQQKPEQGGSQ